MLHVLILESRHQLHLVDFEAHEAVALPPGPQGLHASQQGAPVRHCASYSQRVFVPHSWKLCRGNLQFHHCQPSASTVGCPDHGRRSQKGQRAFCRPPVKCEGLVE